jgi:hypothetical protein
MTPFFLERWIACAGRSSGRVMQSGRQRALVAGPRLLAGAASVLMLLVALPTSVQESGFAVLRLGPFADHAAMGETYTAYASGPAAMYGNPAGLAQRVGNNASLTYQSWIGETNIYSIGARFQAGRRGGIGVLVSMFGSGTLDARDQPGPGDPFEVQYVTVGAAYGLQIGPLRAGVTGKFLSERIYTESASGLALDAGVQTSLFGDDLMFGASVHNIGSMDELGAESTSLPVIVRMGAAGYPISIYSEGDREPTVRVFVSPEVLFFPNDSDTRVNVGAGVELPGVIAVRAGYLSGDAARSVTFGAGLTYAGFVFDYGFVPLRDDFGPASHILTLRYEW